MNKIVFGNLGLLDIYIQDQILISEGNELSLMGKEDYNIVGKLQSLEYPIYFTYHELLNKISYDKDLSYSKKISYLDKIYESLDVLIQYIDDYEEENNKICFIIDNIYERYEKVKSQTVYTWGENMIFIFDNLVDSFRNTRKYLYFTPTLYPLIYLKPGEFLENEGECDSDSDDSNYSDDTVVNNTSDSDDTVVNNTSDSDDTVVNNISDSDEETNSCDENSKTEESIINDVD